MNFIVLDSYAIQDARTFLKAIDASGWFSPTAPEVSRQLEDNRLFDTYGNHALPGGLVCSARLGSVEPCL